MRPAILAAIVALLIPSAVLLYAFPDLPRFGSNHDEAVYWVSAKSLTDAQGYRIASLPGEPAQTKYPPLYPLLLSMAWHLNPEFPANLTAAGWLSWLAIPAILLQLGWWFPRLGFSTARTILLLTLFALNPYILLAGTQLLSELWFLALLLAAVIALERAVESDRWQTAALAGLLAGLTYLTRTAGLMLVPAALVFLWSRRRLPLAKAWLAAMLPFVAGWMLWARLFQAETADPALIYYVDYFRYQLYAVSFDLLPVLLWKNADGLLWSLGGFVIPKVTSSLFLKILAQVIAVAMISGIVRLWRRGAGRLFALYAAFSALLLLVWHYPPQERFVLPLLPLALAGLLTELEHFFGLLRAARQHKDRSQRVVAAGMTGLAAMLVAGVVGLQVYLDAFYLPEDARQARARRADREPAYKWLRENTPADVALLSSSDPLVWLYTGRHAMRKTMPPSLWYKNDRKGMIAWMSDLQPFARRHGLSHLDFAGVDLAEGIEEEDRDTVNRRVRDGRSWTLLFQEGEARIYSFSGRGDAAPSAQIAR